MVNYMHRDIVQHYCIVIYRLAAAEFFIDLPGKLNLNRKDYRVNLHFACIRIAVNLTAFKIPTSVSYARNEKDSGNKTLSANSKLQSHRFDSRFWFESDNIRLERREAVSKPLVE